jgi:anthranilate synthase component 2
LRLLILDNYDSFTYNLALLIGRVSEATFDVIQNDRIGIEEVERYDRILLSPGPGLPSEAGIMPQIIKRYHQTKPIFGVCLGLQAVGEAFGCKLQNLGRVYHGLATPVCVVERDLIFKGCPSSFLAGRYHSWVIDRQSLSDELVVTALDDEGNIMAARHKTFNVRGVQFHPESILSEHGEIILRNWLENA